MGDNERPSLLSRIHAGGIDFLERQAEERRVREANKPEPESPPAPLTREGLRARLRAAGHKLIEE